MGATNRERGEVEIQLDKPRNLKLTLSALVRLEDELGVGILSGETLGLKMKSLKGIATILFCALLHEDENMTLATAITLIEQAPGNSLVDRIGYCSDKIAEAMALATGPEAKKKIEAEMAKKEQAGTG